MAWPVARAALDHLLESGADARSLELTGGEPLLAPDLVRKCIDYARSRSAADRPVKILVATNGLLLTPALLDYFEEQDVALRISVDGVAEANELRASGTFSLLDGLLDDLASTHPQFLSKRVAVGLTLVAGAVPHFGRSIRYLAANGVPSIRVYPRMTPDPDWTPAHAVELERQTDDIVAFSVAHWRRSGDVPVEFLRSRPARPEGSSMGFVCGGPTGRGFCVDPDGHAWACPMLASSLRRLPTKALELSSVMDLGHALDPALPRRLAELPERARSQPLLTGKTERYSSFRPCRDCAFEGGCFVCPATLCHNEESQDVNRVPEALCAFNRSALRARAEFSERTSATTGATRKEELAGALKRLTDALMRSEARSRPDA
jgi:sulfatase maturation enzyme AslB (radical SAM superfamily)